MFSRPMSSVLAAALALSISSVLAGAAPLEDRLGLGVVEALLQAAPPALEPLDAAPSNRLDASLTAAPILDFETNVPGRRLGTSVAVAGDVNGDGFSDLVALGVQFNGPTTLYLFFGGPTGPTLAPGYPYTGLPFFCSMVAGVGDLDGNGLADVAVGWPNASGGSVYVFYGRDGTLDLANPFVETSTSLNGFGQVVAPAGDLNADGVDDLVVGSPVADNLLFHCGAGFSGRVDVYFGAAGTGLSSSNHWEVNGCLQPGTTTEFGFAVGTAGDVNGDGVDDLVIGSPSAQRSQAPFNEAGRVYILHGSASGLPMHPTIAGQGALIGATVLEAVQDGSRFGAAAITAGDVNGDGFADLAVGSPLEDNVGGRDLGALRVYAGSSSGIQSGTLLYSGSGDLFSHLGTWIAPAGDINGDGRADLMGGESGRVYVIPSIGPSLGYTGMNYTSTSGFGFCTAGDMNGDGLSDVAIGDPDFGNGEGSEGRIRVFAGRGDGPAIAPNWSLSTNLTEANLGTSVASAGDVNGDGFEDYLTSAPTLPNIANPGENSNGGVFLNYGGFLGPTPGFADWSFVGQPNDGLGIEVASAGDLNGDGFGDFMAGADQVGFGPGKVLIWYGKSAHLVPGSAPDVTLIGPDPHSQFGSALTAGDFNGDGYSDIAVGAPTADLTGPTVSETGRVYVYLGGPGGPDATYDFIRLGSFANDHLGSSLAGGGDVNGDGYCDLIIGVPDGDDSALDGGRVEVWIGQPTAPYLDAGTSRFGTTAGIRMGHHVAYAGDVNGDGFSDVIVGMPAANSSTGKVMVHTGAPGPTWVSLAPFWTQDGFQSGGAFGSAVSTAGDIDGDGLSDVLIGSALESNGALSQNGGARVFCGPLPPGAAPKFVTGGTTDGAHFGHALACAGDVNGDGWSDLLVGAPTHSNTLLHQGLAVLHFGGYGIGRLAFTLPQKANGTRIALRGLADPGSFRMAAIAVSAAGRTKLRLQWKTQLPPFFPASATPAIGTQGFFTPTGTPGAFGSAGIFLQTIGGLATGGPYAWQMRTLCKSVYFPTTRWISPVRNGGKEYDLRSPGTWVAVRDEPGAGAAALSAPWPNPMTSRSTIAFDLPRAGDVSLEVLDLQGRRVRTLVSGARTAGRQVATWDGRDESGRALGAGIYFYRLVAGAERRTQRVVRMP